MGQCKFTDFCAQSYEHIFLYSSPLNFDEYATPHRPRTPGLICIIL